MWFPFVQATDFLGDEGTLTQLCKQASSTLLAPYLQSGDKNVDPALSRVRPPALLADCHCIQMSMDRYNKESNRTFAKEVISGALVQ